MGNMESQPALGALPAIAQRRLSYLIARLGAGPAARLVHVSPATAVRAAVGGEVTEAIAVTIVRALHEVAGGLGAVADGPELPIDSASTTERRAS